MPVMVMVMAFCFVLLMFQKVSVLQKLQVEVDSLFLSHFLFLLSLFSPLFSPLFSLLLPHLLNSALSFISIPLSISPLP